MPDRGAIRAWRDRRGATAAEFALILPVFTLMTAATLQYGVMMYTYNAALNGARSAARALAVGKVDEAGARAIMAAAMPGWVTADGGDHDRGGGNGDPADVGGYGGIGSGTSGNGGNGAGGAVGGVVYEATDALAGTEVRTAITIPSRSATVLPLGPMPDNLAVNVRMVKEG